MRVTQKNFQAPLLQALKELSGNGPGTPISCHTAIPRVCEIMNISEDAYGIATGTNDTQVSRWVMFAFRELRELGYTSSIKKGTWAITEVGMNMAKNAVGESPAQEPTAVPSFAKAEDALAIVPTTNVVRLPLSPQMDPYIRSLLINQTPCFGYYSSRSDICNGCSLSTACVESQYSHKSALGKQLMAKAEGKPIRGERLSIEDMIYNVETEKATPKGGDDKDGLNDLAKSKGYKIIKLQARVPACSHCKQPIEQGSLAAFNAKNPAHTTVHTHCLDKI